MDELLRRNPAAPHAALVGVECHVRAVAPTGHLSADPASVRTLLVRVDAKDLAECEEKVAGVLAYLRGLGREETD